MGLLQEGAILSGDVMRGAYCLAYNLVHRNTKAHVDKKINVWAVPKYIPYGPDVVCKDVQWKVVYSDPKTP